MGSFAVNFGDHLRSRIIYGPFWGSFAVGDHLRYCTRLCTPRYPATPFLLYSNFLQKPFPFHILQLTKSSTLLYTQSLKRMPLSGGASLLHSSKIERKADREKVARKISSLLQSATSVIRKCDSFFYYKVRWSVITKYDSFFITKCDSYYKVWQFYYKVRRLLQSATVQGAELTYG